MMEPIQIMGILLQVLERILFILPVPSHRVTISSTLIGGTPQMSINPVTGEISCLSGHYLDILPFAVRVEEFRNGVKIGEVRRDAQYARLLPCVLANPPVITFSNDDPASPSSRYFFSR